ncbi:GNAT family N-acetyltransferase [Streptomyces pactum]|uniref:GNAT family N-acetyltransferase n=1 Tax=Streptomyces pactum TaxID=68249 RepID=UPI0018D6E33B|nr:GNAT family N-acetyltransferase [Streptomyces pactum]
MDRPSQIIECGDLVLRRWRGRSDFALAFRLIEESVDHLSPWMPWAAGHGEESTREFLATSEEKWASGETFNYAVGRDGRLVGMCQTYRGADPRGWGLGYWLHPAATGRGIATTAVAALITEMFTLPGVEYLEIRHDLANTSSGAVPRRLGFTEVRRERAEQPVAPACCGIDVIWRLDRPASPAAGGPAGPAVGAPARRPSGRVPGHPDPGTGRSGTGGVSGAPRARGC